MPESAAAEPVAPVAGGDLGGEREREKSVCVCVCVCWARIGIDCGFNCWVRYVQLVVSFCGVGFSIGRF